MFGRWQPPPLARREGGLWLLSPERIVKLRSAASPQQLAAPYGTPWYTQLPLGTLPRVDLDGAPILPPAALELLRSGTCCVFERHQLWAAATRWADRDYLEEQLSSVACNVLSSPIRSKRFSYWFDETVRHSQGHSQGPHTKYSTPTCHMMDGWLHGGSVIRVAATVGDTFLIWHFFHDDIVVLPCPPTTLPRQAPLLPIPAYPSLPAPPTRTPPHPRAPVHLIPRHPIPTPSHPTPTHHTSPYPTRPYTTKPHPTPPRSAPPHLAPPHLTPTPPYRAIRIEYRRVTTRHH